MDINILLLWQSFRNGAGGCLTEFMTKMSYLGEMKTMLISTALIYWCVTRMEKSAGRVWGAGQASDGVVIPQSK